MAYSYFFMEARMALNLSCKAALCSHTSGGITALPQYLFWVARNSRATSIWSFLPKRYGNSPRIAQSATVPEADHCHAVALLLESLHFVLLSLQILPPNSSLKASTNLLSVFVRFRQTLSNFLLWELLHTIWTHPSPSNRPAKYASSTLMSCTIPHTTSYV